MTDINTINKKHCHSARPWKSSTKNSDVDARAPFDMHAEEARSSYQKALGLVAGLPSIDAAPVYPRVVASRALAHHATSAVVAHNHPSGALTPSHFDVAVTQKLSKALKLLDIQLLDHLIAANGRCISLRNLGFV